MLYLEDACCSAALFDLLLCCYRHLSYPMADIERKRDVVPRERETVRFHTVFLSHVCNYCELQYHIYLFVLFVVKNVD